jgi:pyruvate/2-oxoglutarate dehydrogenase complex dihydrolipoamide acyltransferase (E2) component
MNSAARISPIAPQRRHTLRFLEEIRSFSPVFLSADADATRILEHRAAARERGRRYSVVTYILYAAGRVLAAHPEANAAINGTLRPKVARFEAVNAKLTFDRTMSGQRVVLSGVLPGVDGADLDEIQDQVDHFVAGNPERMPEFGGARLLQKLPTPFGRLAFRLGARPLGGRAQRLGTFAVTSLGHRPVDDFYSVGGTTITLGIGRIAPRPVVRGGAVEVSDVLRFTVTFDHRVIDGAEAADIVADLVAAMENFATESDSPAETNGSALVSP